MATTGTTHYSRTILILVKGGTKLTRKFFEKRVKDLSPEGQELTIDDFLLKHKSAILQEPTGKNKEKYFFPTPPAKTDIEKWDLYMFCFVLIKTCDLSPTLRMYVQKLQKLRNKLCHLNDATLGESQYEEYMEKIDCCFNKCLDEINDADFSTELNDLVNSVKHGSLALEDTVKIMHAFYKMDIEQKQILEKHSKDHEGFDNKLDKMMQKLESIDSNLQQGNSVDVPAVEIVIEVKNCTADKEAKVLEFLVKRLNELINNQESGLEDVTNVDLHKIREILQQTLKDLFALGRHIIRVEQKCILLRIKCTSLTSLISLLRDYRSSQLTRQLHGLQTAFRLFDGCEDVEIDTIIFQDAFWNVMDKLVVNLEEQVQRRQYAIHPLRPHTELANGRSLTDLNGSRVNDLDDIRFGGSTIREDRTGETNAVRITVHTVTHSDQKQLQRHFETGAIDHGMKVLQEEIAEQLHISNVSITARLVQRDFEKNAVSDQCAVELPNIPQKHQMLNNINDSETAEAVVQQEVSSLADKSDGDFDSQCIPKGCEHSSSRNDVLKAGTDLTQQIEQLLENGYSALISQGQEDTRSNVLQVAAKVDSLLKSHSDFVSHQKLSDWYEDCAFILNQVGEHMMATRCYYKAMVFDDHWNGGRHLFMSDMLWGLTFWQLQNMHSKKNLNYLLVEIELLAIVAEQHDKWHICAAIDEDLNKVYLYLGQSAGAGHTSRLPKTRTPSLKRLARCNYKMGLHNNARQYCIKILKDTCDYDDTEALEIWARSLFATEDYDLAFQKCRLAMQYCMDTDVERLQLFQSEIQSKMKKADTDQTEPNMEWLEGTNVGNMETVTKKPTEEKVKTRHKRPKAKNRSENAVQFVQARQKEKYTKEPIVREQLSGKGGHDDKDSHNQEENRMGRSRNSSLCSTATIETDTSAFGSETCINNSSSDTDLDDNLDDDYIGSSRREYSDTISIPEFHHEEYEMQENVSFYDQSYKLHIENEKCGYLKEVTENENLLKTGIYLNQEYLEKIVTDKRPNREEFYSADLSKEQLLHKLIQDPRKYIKCVLHNEGSHEAFCTPIDSSTHEIGVIEITGRSKIGQAFNDDVVVVELLDDKSSKDKRYGKVLGLLERQRHKNIRHPVFICTLDNMDIHLMKPVCKTVPKIHVLDREISSKYKTSKERLYKIEVYHYDEDNGTLCNPHIFHIDPEKRDSFICLVAYINWGPRHIYPSGAILKILPPGSDVSSGLNILNLKYEVPRLYDRGTVEMVAKIIANEGDEPAEHHLCDRTDLTKMNIFTVGKANSELSCAFSVERLDTGYKIGVHIADVATYIPKDSLLDEEAKRRTTTFNSDIKKPRNMIPEPLSSKLCLFPEKRRLTISVFLYIGMNGLQMQMDGNNYEIKKSFIKCKRHFTEEEAQILTNDKARENDKITKDVKTLFRVASLLRSCRRGIAKYSLDWNEPQHDQIKPSDAVKECLIMANKKVAERLLRSYRQAIPIYYKPTPPKVAVECFLRKYQSYIDSVLRLQDKQIGPKKPKIGDCRKSSEAVFLSKVVWEAMVASPENATQYLRKDEIHPMQRTVCSSWRSIQNDWEFKCSGSINDKDDITQTSFTHFTSPLDNYSDLIVQRLIHSAVFQKKVCPYNKEEMNSLCIHMNSVVKRASQYRRECRLLQEASKMKQGDAMINCSVEEISEKGLIVCSPFFKGITKVNKELPFNLLGLSAKPLIFQDHNTKWDNVKTVWRRRLYDFELHVKNPSDRGQELQLNPHEGVVHLTLHKWAKLLQLMVEGDSEVLFRAIKSADVSHHHEGVDDVSTECFDTVEIQPYTTFSMTFSIGKQVKIQFSPAFHSGIITPKPMLYDMTNNVKFCLLHTEDPVLHLYKYATRTTCDKYKSEGEYLKRWIPILLMESATGVCRNEESCNITNVPVKLSKIRDRTGMFNLNLAHCEVRNIEFSGIISDNDEDEDDCVSSSSFDWLCLKATVPTDTDIDGTMSAIQQPYSVWVGHAGITKVKKSKDAVPGGKLTVFFTLCDKSPDFPSVFYQKASATKFNIEILRKTEVDRRTESFIRRLPKVQGSLAANIALNLQISDLDKGRKHIASLIERDLCFGNSTVDPRRRPLPPNNKKRLTKR